LVQNALLKEVYNYYLLIHLMTLLHILLTLYLCH